MRLVAAKATKGGRAVAVILEHVAHATPSLSAESITAATAGNAETTETRTRVEFEIPSAGVHLAMNACAAAAIATSLGVSLDAAAQSLSRFQPVDRRCRVEDFGPAGRVQILVINDCYNANPVSVEASLELLQSVKTNRRIAVLGDMLELGGISLRSHKEILELCLHFKLDLVIVVGSCFSEAAEGFAGVDQIIAFRNTSSLMNHLARFLSPGDAVLVKGSRGMRMEVIVDAIKTWAESWQSVDHLRA